MLALAQLQHYSQLQPVKSTVIDFYIAIERSSHTSRFNIYNPWAQDTGGQVLSEPHAAACRTKNISVHQYNCKATLCFNWWYWQVSGRRQWCRLAQQCSINPCASCRRLLQLLVLVLMIIDQTGEWVLGGEQFGHLKNLCFCCIEGGKTQVND